VSNYTKSTDFDVKDSLPAGDTGKIIRGAEFEVEFENIEVAIASKADATDPTFAGTANFTNINITGNTTLGNAATDTVTISGDIAVDTDTLFVDVSENKVGIGTSVPTAFLEVSGSTTSGGEDIIHWSNSANVNKGMLQLSTTGGGKITLRDAGNVEDVVIDSTGVSYFNGGNVGIGTDAPATILHLAEDNPLIRFEDTAGGAPYTFDVGSDGGLFKVINTTSTATPFVIEGATGDVGIGTTNPAADLEVSSDANTKVRISDSTNVNQRFEISHNAGFTALTSGNNSVNGQMAFYQFDGTDTTEAMRIDPEGRVGIGTSSPTSALTVAGDIRLNDSFPQIVAQDTDDNTLHSISMGSGTILLSADSSDVGDFSNIRFNVDGNEYLRINTGGNVGIGTTAPPRKLSAKSSQQVVASFESESTTTGGISLLDANTTNDSAVRLSAVADSLSVYTGGSETFRVTSGGNVGIGDTTPSRKLSVRDVSATPFISIVGSQSSVPGLLFGDADSDSIGQIRYDNADNSMAFTTSNTEKMVITAAGSVGIGTGTPDEKLQVNGDAVFGDANTDGNVYIRKRFDGAAAVKFQRTTAGSPIDASITCDGAENLILSWNESTDISNQILQLQSNNSEVARFDSNGNFLLGTNNDNVADAGVGVRPSGRVNIRSDAGGTAILMGFYNSSATAAGSIQVTTTTTSFNTSSDVRLKENITDAPEGNVDALQVRSFDWKINGEHQEYGFIAQELETVAPYAVSRGETEDDIWGVDYSKLVPMLVKEIQDLKARIATLEAN
jgi:hypothetical protein